MPADFSESKQAWGGTLKGFGVGLCVFLLGRELAIWLTVRNVHGWLAFLDNVLAGAAAALLVFLYEHWRQRAVNELRESERRFRLVANAAPVMIWMSGTDKFRIYFNQPWLDFTGRSIEQEWGNGWAEGVHPQDLKRCLATYTEAFDLRQDFKMEYRLRRHDGDYRWVFGTGVPRYRQDGSFAGYIGSCVDVTERKRAEEARLRHAAVIESSEDAIISKNLDGIIVSWNAGAQRLFGYTESEAVEQPITMLIPPELQGEESKIRERLRAGGRIEHYETTRVTKTGKRVDVSLTIGPIKDSNGSVVGFSEIAHDITTRKQAEHALVESEERLLLAARVARMFAYSWDATTDSIQRSGESAEILGVDDKLANTGEAVLAMVHPDDRERLEAALAGLTVENPILQISYRIIRPDGAIAWLERNSRAYFDEHGKLARIIGMIRDITAQKNSEEALSTMTRKLIDGQEQERTRIARELHDDVSQQLAMLVIELDHRDHSFSGSSGFHTYLARTRQRIIEIAHDVQTLSHQLHSSKLEYLGLSAAAKSLCTELAQKSDVQIDFSQEGVSRSLPNEVSLSLFRILQEALHNAIEHSGTKNFEVRLFERSSEIVLMVKDSGNGFDISAGMRGTGLGLTSMRERVRLVNGTIVIDSKPNGGGTTIRVCVPLGSKRLSEQKAG
jgi:PAS domain S-box-containing protein